MGLGRKGGGGDCGDLTPLVVMPTMLLPCAFMQTDVEVESDGRESSQGSG